MSEKAPIVHHQLCGGLNEASPATPEIQAIVDGIKHEIQPKLGDQAKDLSDLKAVSFKQQCVAGTNYFVKVNVKFIVILS
jgi:hypothetical protein